MRDEMLAGRFDGLVIWNGFCRNFNWVIFLEDLVEVRIDDSKHFFLPNRHYRNDIHSKFSN